MLNIRADWKCVIGLSVAVLVVLLSTITAAQTQNNDKKFLDDARNAYSTLRRQGVQEVRASVIPNWTPLLANVEPKNKPTAFRLAKRLTFSVLADTRGNIVVNHLVSGPKPNKATAEVIDTMAKGVELSVTGFMMSWAPFMLTDLIPAKLDSFVLQDLNSERLLTFRQGPIDVTVAIKNDLAISELRTAQGSMKPLLTRMKDGFMLTGYDADNEDPALGRVVLSARIATADTQGFSLPKTVTLKGSAAGSAINVELNFINYRLKTATEQK